MRKVIVLGATGSVGTSTLAVLRAYPGEFEVVGLAAGRGGRELAELCREFSPQVVSLADTESEAGFRELLAGMGVTSRVLSGSGAAIRMLLEVEADIRVAAVSGTAGLEMAFAAARLGGRILLANKEVLVSAGRLFLAAARAGGTEILSIDSEHSALTQCLDGRSSEYVDRLVITASGGPFRGWTKERMSSVRPEEALRHPVWKMGAKISVDSATLANKALEVIEAHHLFAMPFGKMRVLVHPQSVIHGMVEFSDGSLIAHMAGVDMKLPIQYALFYPARKDCILPRLDLAGIGQLTFEEPDTDSFPLLKIGLGAGKGGERCAAAFNAANEAAVGEFLASRLRFTDIAPAVEDVLSRVGGGDVRDLDDVLAVHAMATAAVRSFAGVKR